MTGKFWDGGLGDTKENRTDPGPEKEGEVFRERSRRQLSKIGERERPLKS